MATETENIILHVVFDGAPRSGKTESIRTLGGLLGRPVQTPEERDGRTLFFDWMQYEGGQRLGRPITCRVVGVPGQPSLGRRRSAILTAADVVVFVVDSTPEGFGASLKHFKDLKRRLSGRDRTIPIFVQLNKRDLPGALDTDVILNNLGAGFKNLHAATVATEGAGIRETFVFAVGEALRAKEEAGLLYQRGNEFSTQEVGLPTPNQLVEILNGLNPMPPESSWLEEDREVATRDLKISSVALLPGAADEEGLDDESFWDDDESLDEVAAKAS